MNKRKRVAYRQADHKSPPASSASTSSTSPWCRAPPTPPRRSTARPSETLSLTTTRQPETPAGTRLIAEHARPVSEARIIQPFSMRRIGHLEALNIDRAKQFLQRRLNALYINGLAAVGTFNAVPIRTFGDEICWGGELHVVVAGVDWNPLIDALSFRRCGYRNWWQDRPRVHRVEDIGLAVDECLQRIPRETNELPWYRALKHPSLLSEYYRWSL